MSLRSPRNNTPIAWRGSMATMKMAVGSDPDDFSPHDVGSVAPDHRAIFVAPRIPDRQHHAAVSRRDETRHHECAVGRGEDRSPRLGKPATFAQLYFHVEPRLEPRSASIHSFHPRTLFGADQERGLSPADFWQGAKNGGNGPGRSQQSRGRD